MEYLTIFPPTACPSFLARKFPMAYKGGDFMAGPRQPIQLMVAKGAKNLTKAEIANRMATEVSAGNDKVKAPLYLSPVLKKEFKKIAKELIAIGIMTNLDIDALARFVISKDLYLKLLEQINGDDELLQDYNAINNLDKLFKMCSTSASALGLTISSRCKLVMPQPKEIKKENKFDRFASRAQ
jgi:P27 family predicted phage terminase small subunit